MNRRLQVGIVATLAALLVATAATAAPALAVTASGARSADTRAPAIVSSGLAQQCIVASQIIKTPLTSAGSLLVALGCRVRVVYQPSKLRRGLVIGVLGGVRSWPSKHLVTVFVSSGT